MTTATKITLGEFWARDGVGSLFLAGVGMPSGQQFDHDTDAEGEDYCDVGDVIEQLDLGDLEGTVDSEGIWQWDGKGERLPSGDRAEGPRDWNGNTIYKVQAW